MRKRVHFTGCLSLLAGAVAACMAFACGTKGPGFSGGDDAAASSSGSSHGSSGTGSTSGGSSGAGSGSSSGTSSGSGASSGGSGGGRDSGPNDGGSHSDSGASSDGGARVRTNVLYDDAGVPLCGTPCPLTSNICCVDALGNATCHAQSATCNQSAVFRCVSKSDCQGKQICCGVANQTASTAGSECQDVSTTGNHCTPVATSASSTQGSAQLCQTNGECLSGSCLWQDCTVGTGVTTVHPSLTLCGIQSAAPFNCVAHP
jgi:hypothetical protein